MSQSGSEKRQRCERLQVRLSIEEAALVYAKADRAGMTPPALARYALLNEPPPRSSRRPPVDRAEVARMIGNLGALAQSLREATASGDQSRIASQIEATHRDIADMCHACFQALGRHR